MLQPRATVMSFDEYLVWEDAQDEKHELIDGVPVPKAIRMMAGGTGRHAALAMNLGTALRNRLRGGPCAPYGSDLKVKTRSGARYPNVTVDCSRETGRAVWAQDPRVVFEVLSPANDTMAVTRLLADYQAIDSLSAIVFLAQDAPHAQVFRREGAWWEIETLTGLEAVLAPPGLAVEIPLSEIYDGVELGAA